MHYHYTNHYPGSKFTNTLAVGELSGDFVTTNTAQTISGAKTFTSGATAVQPNNTTPAFSVTYSGGILSFYADKITYLPASGGNTYTFTFPSENGAFALASDISDLNSTLRAYINQQLALKFDKTGGTVSGSVNVTENVTAGGDVNAQSGNFSEGITVDKQITLRGNPETDTSESVLQHKEYGFNFYDVEEGTDLSGKSLFFDTGISPLDDSNFNGTSLETLISFQNGYTLYVNPTPFYTSDTPVAFFVNLSVSYRANLRRAGKRGCEIQLRRVGEMPCIYVELG